MDNETVEHILPGATSWGVGVVSVASTVSHGFTTGAAMRVVLLTSSCPAEVDTIPRLLHPTGIDIMDSPALGAAVMNVVIVAASSLLSVAVYYTLKLAVPACAAHNSDLLGLLRLPSAPLFIFQYLFQGTTLAGMILIVTVQSTFHAVVGIVVLCGCACVTYALWHAITANVPTMACYAKCVNRQSVLSVLALGEGEWVNLLEDRDWVHSYASVIRTYKQAPVWYIVVEFAASFALSGVFSLGAETKIGCGHQRCAAATVFWFLLGLEALVWPHAKQRDSASDVVLLGLQSVAMALQAGYFYGADESLFLLSSYLLLLSTAVLLVKAVWDVTSEVYIICSGRRTALQADVYRTLHLERTLNIRDTEASNSSSGQISIFTATTPSMGMLFPCPSTVEL